MEGDSYVTLVAEGKAAEIEHRVRDPLQAAGYEIVRVQWSRGDRAKLQLMVERTGGDGMTVDDCAQLSRMVAAILDVEDPIEEPYVLELSSPGIDRPLTRLADFGRFSGFEAKLETRLPVAGRRRFKGRLLGLEGATVKLATPECEVALDFEDIEKAKLVLNDELLSAHQAAQRN